MKKILLTCMLTACALCAKSQTYTTAYPKEMQKVAARWVKKGEWRNGFTKASPAPNVNLTEFYIQYQRNPAQWQALFRWLQETDLVTSIYDTLLEIKTYLHPPLSLQQTECKVVG